VGVLFIGSFSISAVTWCNGFSEFQLELNPRCNGLSEIDL
jgi:hypothetical protein